VSDPVNIYEDLMMMNIRRCRGLGLTLLILAAPVPAPVLAQDEASDGRNLVLDDYGSFYSPGAPRISPGGEQIAEQIFVVSDGNAEPRPVTSSATSAWSPRWSSDGNSLYFLSDRSDSSQLWKLPVNDFGEAEQLTDFEHGISAIKLSPDETRLLLSFSDNDFQEEPEDAEPQPFVVTRRQFKRDAGGGYISEGDSHHLYLYDIEGESLTQITSGTYEEGSAAWSPDGDAIVFVSNRNDPDAEYSSDLWIVRADNTDKGQTLKRLTNNPDAKQSPSWSPDGKLIAYVTAVEGPYGLPHIAVVPTSEGDPRTLTTELDRWVSRFEFSDDGDWIYFNYDNSGATHLARVRVRDGKIEKLLEGDRVVSSFDVGDNGDVAIRANNRNDTSDIYRLSGSRLDRLTDLNQELFSELNLGSKFRVSYESDDGTVVEAFITTPPDYETGNAYPAILNIHGGPVGQFSWGFDFKGQFFASNGYVFIEPNPRGSTGRGQDFIDAIYRTWGVTEYDDVISSVDFAVEQGIADPNRLAVTGYSYGGYMTNVVITRTKRFKAAASGAGHSLIEANVGHDIYQQWYMWELGFPWENRERYDLLSPLLRAGNVKTPTIFLGGRIDWNVPILNAELFYQALQVQGIDSTLVVYPGMHHGGWLEEFEKDYLQRILDWFDHYVLNDQMQISRRQEN
jgi:dipeptidyl aminopeptidase/acylaminoacyl peptidase